MEAGEMKLRMLMYGANFQEAEALILQAIQALEPYQDEGEDKDIKEIIDDLRVILDFLRDKTPEEWSGLHCLICEAIAMAVVVNVIEGEKDNSLFDRVKSLESWRQVIKLRMLTCGVDGEEDPEALMLWAIRHLDSIDYEGFKGVIYELRMILDVLREEKTTNVILRRRHYKYLICDLIEVAMYLVNIEENTGNNYYWEEAKSVQIWLREIRLRMLKPGVDDDTVRLENTDGEGDEVGLDEQVKFLLETAIFNERQDFQTSVITGMVGVGKTSLARQLYNHATVVDWFEHRAWARVSGDLTRKEILIKLIRQVVDGDQLLQTDLEKIDNVNLQFMLHQHLEGTKYFIVLDDLPKQMHLKSLLDALPEYYGKGSRLLVTSITKDVQTSVCHIHQVNPLDSDNSWKLFLNTVFRFNNFTSEYKFPKHVEKKAREMLRKCGGLPLAIKQVGKQLAEKRRAGNEWEELVESIDWDSTLELLEIFYQQLDQEQKSCFLHLALFKENTTMRAVKLLDVFVAGGVVASQSKLMSYLSKLNNEFIIEFNKWRMSDRMKGCFINPVLHRLSIKKAEEEIGLEIMSKDGNNRPSLQSPRHRVINCSREKFDYSSKNQDKHLVSLFFRGGGYLEDALSYWKSFELLKTLDLEDFGLKDLPESIGTLIDLRYLGLRNNYLKKLPDSLVYLNKLEILDIALNFMLEVPDIIWDLSSLLCVYMSDAIFQKPLKIETLRKLTTVMHISVDDLTCELSSLQMMSSSLERLGIEEEEEEVDGSETSMSSSLEGLGIEEEVDGSKTMSSTSLEGLGIEEEEEEEEEEIYKRLSIDNIDGNVDGNKLLGSLAELDDLEHLILRGFRFRSMPCLDGLGILRNLTTLKLEGLLPRLPNDFPPNIQYLKLVNSCLDEDPMPLLHKMRLRNLTLKNAYTGQQMVMPYYPIPSSFEELRIEELWNLRNIDFGITEMRFLIKLEINNCPLLEMLPEEIGLYMPRLEEFNMTTTKKIATEMRKSGSIPELMRER